MASEAILQKKPLEKLNINTIVEKISTILV
jgi:hypothetical protein